MQRLKISLKTPPLGQTRYGLLINNKYRCCLIKWFGSPPLVLHRIQDGQTRRVPPKRIRLNSPKLFLEAIIVQLNGLKAHLLVLLLKSAGISGDIRPQQIYIAPDIRCSFSAFCCCCGSQQLQRRCHQMGCASNVGHMMFPLTFQTC